MHRKGALLCSACSGVLLLAETGLLDGQDATIHWAYAPTFRKNFPSVRLCLDKVPVASGQRAQFVMSGASASWHDLVLCLVARLVGPTAAQAISKFLLLQWHRDGQTPYLSFQPKLDHGDAAVLASQEWLAGHFSVAGPVEELARRSGLPERSFKRRFTRRRGIHPWTTSNACACRRPNIGLSARKRPSMRSVGRSATKTPRSSAGSSNA